MRWTDLAFMHWPVGPAAVRPLIPPGLELDTYEGEAWIGVVPFAMSRVRPRRVPPLPWASRFLELNVRTYVKAEGKPGVWFFSLDAANPLAVRVARRSFHLPYYDAAMSLSNENGDIRYASTRTHRGAPPAVFSAVYHATSPAAFAAPGSLEDFLTNRLCLYCSSPSGRLFRGDIAHVRWPLQPAEARIEQNTMADAAGIHLPDIAPLVHYARTLDVIAWRIGAIGQ